MSYNFHQSPSKSLRQINRKLAEGGRTLAIATAPTFSAGPAPQPVHGGDGDDAAGSVHVFKRMGEPLAANEGQQKRAKISLARRFSDSAREDASTVMPPPLGVAFIDVFPDGAAEMVGVSAIPSSPDDASISSKSESSEYVPDSGPQSQASQPQSQS